MVPQRDATAIVGARIAQERQAQHLSLRDLARRLGWSYATLANYETGRRALSIDRLIQIAQALGCAPAALVIDEPQVATIVTYLHAYPEQVAAVAYFLTTFDEEPVLPETYAPAEKQT